MDEKTVSVFHCARCGGDHIGLKFMPLNNASDEYSFWAMCPAVNQPILMCPAVNQVIS